LYYASDFTLAEENLAGRHTCLLLTQQIPQVHHKHMPKASVV